MLDDKIQEAQQTLRLAADMSRSYYDAPLIICYSGGKDSDVLLDIAKRCLNPDDFEVLNSHTTVDAPETVYHIREVFKNCEAEGIKTTIKMPSYNGKPTSMWKLIEEKTIPPTRLARYCCQVLKESSTPNRMAAVGVRETESKGRQGREVFGTYGTTKKNAEYRSLQHTYAMYKLDQLGKEDAYECIFVQSCKERKNTICNPIYHFTDSDIWDYVRQYNVKMNPLYAKGYKRVGCIGCPLAGGREMNKEFRDYPKYKENYIKAFDRAIAKRKKENKVPNHWKTGEECMRWWLGENIKQIRIEDILNEHIESDNGGTGNNPG